MGMERRFMRKWGWQIIRLGWMTAMLFTILTLLLTGSRILYQDLVIVNGTIRVVDATTYYDLTPIIFLAIGIGVGWVLRSRTSLAENAEKRKNEEAPEQFTNQILEHLQARDECARLQAIDRDKQATFEKNTVKRKADL
jgi:hypothetical protein